MKKRKKRQVWNLVDEKHFWKMHEMRRCVSTRRPRASRPLGSTGLFLHDTHVIVYFRSRRRHGEEVTFLASGRRFHNRGWKREYLLERTRNIEEDKGERKRYNRACPWHNWRTWIPSFNRTENDKRDSRVCLSLNDSSFLHIRTKKKDYLKKNDKKKSILLVEFI